MSRMITMSFKIDEELYEALRKFAESRNTSRGHVIREALRRYINNPPRPRTYGKLRILPRNTPHF